VSRPARPSPLAPWGRGAGGEGVRAIAASRSCPVPPFPTLDLGLGGTCPVPFGGPVRTRTTVRESVRTGLRPFAVGSPEALRPFRWYFPLTAGGDLFLPYVKTDPHHQQGQFLITREDSPLAAPPQSRKCPDRISGTTQPQNRMPTWVSLGVLGACEVNWGSARCRRTRNRSRAMPLSAFSHKTAIRPRSVFTEFEIAAAGRRRMGDAN